MKKTALIFAITIIAICITLFSACKKIEVTGVYIGYTYAELIIAPDDAFGLTANLIPEDAANQAVRWESDNTSVATVDNDGLVKAIAAGKANIIVSTEDGNFKDSCLVIVDYRGLWVEERAYWNFTVNDVETMDEETLRDTIIEYGGNITLGDAYNQLNIKYLENNSISLFVDETGILSAPPSVYCEGQFENDTNPNTMRWGEVSILLRWDEGSSTITHKINGRKWYGICCK